jgi:hypothetical protein
VSFPVWPIYHPDRVADIYALAARSVESGQSVALIEYKDFM